MGILRNLEKNFMKCEKAKEEKNMLLNFSNLAWAMGPPPEGQGGGSMIGPLIPLVLIFVIFYLLLIRPQQKRAKEHKELVKNLRRGDWVITQGGLRGKVVSVTDTIATIELPPDNTKIKVTKNYVVGLIRPEEHKE